MIEGTIVFRQWRRAPGWRRQMLAAQVGVGGCAHRRVLRRDGTAAEKIARAALSGVIGDAFPQQAEDDEVAVLRMNTRAPQFNHLRAQWLEALKLKLLRAVITQMPRLVVAGLQAVCADDVGGGQLLHDQMIANGAE